MKYIQLTQNKYAIVDDEDFERLNQFQWSCHHGYAVRDSGRLADGSHYDLFMHRVIMNTPDDLFVDHISGNKLDNRKENLRNCTARNNNQNKRPQKNKQIKYKGVSACDHSSKKFRARITIKGKETFIGFFNSEIDAAKAYNEAAIKEFGEFAWVNPVDEEDDFSEVKNFESDFVNVIPSNRALMTTNTSGYLGVTYCKRKQHFIAQIAKDKKHYYLGQYKSAIDAAKAFNKKALELYGPSATINIIAEDQLVKDIK